MLKIAPVITALLLLCGGAAAETFYAAASGSGLGTNDCLSASTPCTVQRAADQCPNGGHCSVVAASGTYSGAQLNLLYYKHIALIGAGKSGSSCSTAAATVFSDGGASVSIFNAQDHAILTLDCVTLTGTSGGSTGFALRQYSIGDANDVVCGAGMAICFAANESSKINIYNPTVVGGGSRWAYAAGLSNLSVGGTLTVASGLSFSGGFISALFGSFASFYPSISGGSGMSGWAIQCYDSIFASDKNIPGLPQRHASFQWMPGGALSAENCMIR